MNIERHLACVLNCALFVLRQDDTPAASICRKGVAEDALDERRRQDHECVPICPGSIKAAALQLCANSRAGVTLALSL